MSNKPMITRADVDRFLGPDAPTDPAERFSLFVQRIISVPKSVLDAREAEYKVAQEGKPKRGPKPHPEHVRYWISCTKFTVGVTVSKQGLIVEAAPIVKRFVGQPLDNLIRWATRMGDFKMRVLDEQSNEGSKTEESSSEETP